MTGYKIVSLKDIVEEMGEGFAKQTLSTFSCPYNKDVEYYIRHTSIEFAKQNLAPTFLVYASYKNEWVLCGYFTISLKMFTISKKNVGTNTFRRLKKFGTYDDMTKTCNIAAPLIAQLSKNFTGDYNNLITGKELLELACREIRRAQTSIGGKIVYLECEDKSRLLEFYNSFGFREFGKRNLDKEERTKMSGEYLVQMLKYF